MWRRYAHLDAVSPAGFHRRRLVVRAARAASRAPGSILDVGCGQGVLLAELATAFPGARIAGSDVSETSLRQARERHPGAELFEIDLLAESFEEEHRTRLGTFDVVVCSEVVEHLTDDRRAVARLASLLGRGGALVLTVPGGTMSAFDVAIGHVRHYRPRDVRALLRSADLRVHDVLAWGFPFHSLYRSAVRVASKVALPSESSRKDAGSTGEGLLGRAYGVFGGALKPLFYLNLDRWGEQIVAVASKP